jgi:aldose 1-epimerase
VDDEEHEELHGQRCWSRRGPHAERTIVLNGVTHKLTSYFPPHKHALHGGPKGYSFRVWQPKLENNSELIITPKSVGVRLSLHSPDGEMGYPGNVEAVVTYTLSDNNEYKVEFDASADQETPIMLTTHSYYNLSGDGQRDITGHELQLFSHRFPELDNELITTGTIRDVAGTPMDFSTPHLLGERIRGDYDMLRHGNNGYDLAFVLDKTGTPGAVEKAVRLKDPQSGRVMEISTDQLCVQLYTGNHLDIAGKKGRHYGRFHGVCFEMQGYTSASNRPQFPSIFVKPGQKYKNVTVHRFSAE